MHVWKGDEQATRKIMGEQSWNSLQTRPSFTKQRVIPTYFDGIQAGFVPRDLDFASLTAAHERAFRQALSARALISTLHSGKASDGRPLAVISEASAKVVPEPGAEDAAYMIRPNIKPGDPVSDYRLIDHAALRGWRWATNDSEGNPIFVQGDMLVHPQIYQHLKNNLTPSAIQQFQLTVGGKTFRPGAAVLHVGQEIKSGILSFSGFHQTTLGIHALEHRTAPAFMPEINTAEGSVDRKLINSGLMVAHYNAAEAFGEGVQSHGLITKIPGIGPAYAAYTDYLFKDYLPRLKMAMAKHALERNQQRYGDKLSKQQIYNLTADQANAAFGGLNYRVLGRNRTFQDALRLVLMAPDFTEARARFVGQAVKPHGREQLVALGVGAAAMYTASAILNQMISGNPRVDKPFTLVKDKKEYELRTIQGDLQYLVSDPAQFMRNRLSPLFNLGVQAITGRNRFGQKQTITQQLSEAAKQNVPIPIQPFTRGKKETPGQKIGESVLKMIGINARGEKPDKKSGPHTR